MLNPTAWVPCRFWQAKSGSPGLIISSIITSKMKSSKTAILKGEERRIFRNDSFKIQSVFSNGRPGTGRPDNLGPLIVFNDDIVSPEGFLGLHPHQNT